MRKRNIIVCVILFFLFLLAYSVLSLFQNYEFKNKHFIPKPGSCLILQEKYCKKAKIINNNISKSDIALGFNLPKETPVFSPAAGRISSPLIFIDDFNVDNQRFSGFVIETDKDNFSSEHILLLHIPQSERFVDYKNTFKGETLENVSNYIDNQNENNLIYVYSEYDNSAQEIVSVKSQILKLFKLSIK